VLLGKMLGIRQRLPDGSVPPGPSAYAIGRPGRDRRAAGGLPRRRELRLERDGGDRAPPLISDDDVRNLVAFGEDADGETYALSLDGPVYRLVP